MKKIKFRGLAIEDYTGKPITEKKFVYGNVWANEDNSYVITGEYKDKKGCCYNYKVDPDSIAQLIGYDKNGDEFYSDDKISYRIRDLTDVTKVLSVGNFFNVSEIGGKFDYVELLKERGENENLS